MTSQVPPPPSCLRASATHPATTTSVVITSETQLNRSCWEQGCGPPGETGGSCVQVYGVCTHTCTRVHTKHTDTVVQQCTRAVRRMRRCTPRTHARRTQRCVCLYPDRPAGERGPSGPIIEHTASRETSTHRGRLRCQRHAACTCRCPSRTQTLTHTETLVCVCTGVS